MPTTPSDVDGFGDVARAAAAQWRTHPLPGPHVPDDVRHLVDIPFVAEAAADDPDLAVIYSLALVDGVLPAGGHLDDPVVWTLVALYRIGGWTVRVWQFWDCTTRLVIAAGDGYRFGVTVFDSTTTPR